MTDAPILSVTGLHGWYGKSHILQGVDLAVGNGELLALLGRNGVGKTTTMRAISGTLGRTQGDVRLGGVSILGQPAHSIARKGLSLVPEHRGIFGTLTVEENLSLAARRGSPWSVERIWSMFPSLANRRRTPGGKLSGGEH
jgi:branched-chain amino acid transport system ATP-binding protein